MTEVPGDSAGAVEIARAVRSGSVSAAAVIEAALTRISERNATINAFTAVCEERARGRASELDAARKQGAAWGPLAGVPFGVKAMIDVAGITTTAGSRLYRDGPSASSDAAVVSTLERAGAVCLGVLNMDEFGMGGTTENACFGTTRNPYDVARTAGGSSGGCAAALASGMVPLTIGSDALGSIRLPASLCGVYGLRPSRGTIDASGVLGRGGTISTLGPLARNAHDTEACWQALAPQTSIPLPQRPLRIGRATGYFDDGLDATARSALSLAAAALGAHAVIEFPEPRLARAAAMLINAAESAVSKMPLLRTRANDFDPNTRDRFLAHALMPAQWHLQGQQFRAWHIQELERMFEHVDVLLLPATPCVAPHLGTPTVTIAGIELPTGPALGWFTQPLAATDCPALTVPIATAGALPIGVQLFAPRYCEAWLFAAARQLEHQGVVRRAVAAPPCQ